MKTDFLQDSHRAEHLIELSYAYFTENNLNDDECPYKQCLYYHDGDEYKIAGKK